jgi:hypothetical protein
MNTHPRTIRCLIVCGATLLCSLANAQTFSSPMRDVENPAHSPLRLSGTVTVSVPGFVGVGGAPIGSAIAANRRFVIEHISVECLGKGGVAVLMIRLHTLENVQNGTTTHSYMVPLTTIPNDGLGNPLVFASLPVRLYHDGGNAVNADMFLSGGAPQGGMSCTFELSGYTVSMP